MSRKHVILAVFVFVVIFLGCLKLFTTVFDNKDKAKVVNFHGDGFMDLEDKKTLVGWSDNVFIGKVISEKKYRKDPDFISTQYSVHVMKNIKGKLTGKVIVNQSGGYLKSFGRLFLYKESNDELLIPGETYLFISRFNSDYKFHSVVPFYGTLEIKNEEVMSSLVEEYIEAYKNQTISPY